MAKAKKQRDDRHYCSHCGEQMSEGFVINGGEEYYCSDLCIRHNVLEQDYISLYDFGNGDTYYTEWEEEPQVKTKMQKLCDGILPENTYGRIDESFNKDI